MSGSLAKAEAQTYSTRRSCGTAWSAAKTPAVFTVVFSLRLHRNTLGNVARAICWHSDGSWSCLGREGDYGMAFITKPTSFRHQIGSLSAVCHVPDGLEMHMRYQPLPSHSRS
jgi:hypothetical protein